MDREVTDGIRADLSTDSIVFEDFGNVQQTDQNMYWSLPHEFTGNQVLFYQSHGLT